jgi:hypothetical protein
LSQTEDGKKGVRIQHWPSVGMLNVIVRSDLAESFGEEIYPGVVFHFSGTPDADGAELVRIEVGVGSGAEIREGAILQRFDDHGKVVARTPGRDAGAVTKQ